MRNTDSSKHIQLPVDELREHPIQQASDEIFRLHQVIHAMANNMDAMANKIAIQEELIQQLKDEIARLKGQKPRPDIRSSKLEGQNRKPDWHARIGLHDGLRKIVLFSIWVKGAESFETPLLRSAVSVIAKSVLTLQARAFDIYRLAKPIIKKVKRTGKPGQPKGKPRKKKTLLQIHERPVIQPLNIPEGAVFKGFNRYTVQEIIFKPHNIQYQLARWQLPDGSYITGELPKDIHGHYGPELIAYILHQYHACRVTEHLLLDELRARGILISAGQLNTILIKNKDSFMEELAELLPVAIEVERQVQVDDTGGRHDGKNQYTTVIGNRWCSVFTTTDSKSRVNFLKLLQGGKEHYVINGDTIAYLDACNAPAYLSGYISMHKGQKFTSLEDWEKFLRGLNITQESAVRFVSEAALFASLFEHGIPRDLLIHSDDAGQFDVVLFINTLCWIHEERHYRKLVMTTDHARADLERVQGEIWTIYQALKAFKESPSESFAKALEKDFDDIFQQKTSSITLDQQLKKTYEKKQDLLGVLKRPEAPLHNNASETCARAAKIKLKISGGTRSDMGRKARDTFLSLKQTCRKLGINFITYLQDRVQGLYAIPRLAIVIRERALAAVSDPPHILPSGLDPSLMNLGAAYCYEQVAG